MINLLLILELLFKIGTSLMIDLLLILESFVKA